MPSYSETYALIFFASVTSLPQYPQKRLPVAFKLLYVLPAKLLCPSCFCRPAAFATRQQTAFRLFGHSVASGWLESSDQRCHRALLRLALLAPAASKQGSLFIMYSVLCHRVPGSIELQLSFTCQLGKTWECLTLLTI